MSEYRLNIMDRWGRVALSFAFRRRNDEDALKFASIEAEGCDAELWRRERIVGKLYAEPTAMAPAWFRARSERTGDRCSAGTAPVRLPGEGARP